MHNIKFNKKYPDDTQWTVILQDFLKILSSHYGYDIDEYSMLHIPESFRVNRLEAMIVEGEKDEVLAKAYANAVRAYFSKYDEIERQKEEDRLLIISMGGTK